MDEDAFSMTKIIYLVVISVFFISAGSVHGGTIAVELSEIETREGQIGIGLFNKPAGFPEVRQAFKSVFLSISRKTMQYTFYDVPDGFYAIAVFHDSNTNGKLDKNFLGMPTEGYGFSKNVTGAFGPPSFDDARIKLEGHCNVSIEMK